MYDTMIESACEGYHVNLAAIIMDFFATRLTSASFPVIPVSRAKAVINYAAEEKTCTFC